MNGDGLPRLGRLYQEWFVGNQHADEALKDKWSLRPDQSGNVRQSDTLAAMLKSLDPCALLRDVENLWFFSR
jgi:hypothetical protein